MTESSEVDPAVLAGEPESARQLERGDDDLTAVADAADADDAPSPPADRSEWAAADALLEGQPTELGE